MLEVVLASLGAGIAGAARGYASAFHSKQPWRLYTGTGLLSVVSFFEANRYRDRRAMRQSHIPGASARLMDDSIIESSPTYLVDNFPLFLAIFSSAFTFFGLANACYKRRVFSLFVNKFGWATTKSVTVVKRS